MLGFYYARIDCCPHVYEVTFFPKNRMNLNELEFDACVFITKRLSKTVLGGYMCCCLAHVWIFPVCEFHFWFNSLVACGDMNWSLFHFSVNIRGACKLTIVTCVILAHCVKEFNPVGPVGRRGVMGPLPCHLLLLFSYVVVFPSADCRVCAC